MYDYTNRVHAARGSMADSGVDGMLLSIGADLPYFTGYEAMQTERLTMLVVPTDGEACLFIPELEAPRVDLRGHLFEIRPWTETDDPVGLVANEVAGWGRGLIGDHTWATFAIGIQERVPALKLGRASDITRELRMRKDSTEIEALRSAGRAADRVVARRVFPPSERFWP